MNDVRVTIISVDEAGQRVDNYLLRVLKGAPRSLVYRIIRRGEVRVNKKRVRPSSRLVSGDLVRIPPIRTSIQKRVEPTDSLQQHLHESLIYENAHFIVINKPSGLAVHGGSGVSLGVIEALRAGRTDLPYLELAHRLDKETSGCLLLAKKRSVLRALQALFAEKTIHKTYWALLMHEWAGEKTAEVHAPLIKNQLHSGERFVKVDDEGKPSYTQFKLIENFQNACWVEVCPKTGRTHQIRVHSAHLGHPVMGDAKYGFRSSPLILNQVKPRLYLHARAIQFTLNGVNHSFQAELDSKFTSALASLRSKVP